MSEKTVPLSDHKLVYVWQLPVRIFHWLNVVAIFALCVTGFLIGNPPAIANSAEASFSYWFGIVRFIHFIAGFVFFFNFMMRIYWAFVGNKYARWRNYIPLKKAQWKEIVSVLKVDILHLKNEPLDSIGHNSLALASYFGLFIAFVVQSVTGFALYAAMSDNWFSSLFAWASPMAGGDLPTRQVHHLFMWIFIIFTIIHVYLVFYHDYVERRGITSSMIGGWKFIEKEKTEIETVEDVPYVTLRDKLKKKKD